MKNRNFTAKLITTILSVLALNLIPSAHADVTLMINEFMADNGSTAADPQGQTDDWIEIYNAGPGTADLGGMYLTDDLLDPTQWQFPDGTFLGPDDYLLIWADDDVLDNPNGLHANFKLSAGGEQIGLYENDGVTLANSVSFGDQSEDVSSGRFPNGGSTWYFMDQPTPGAANTTALSEEVYFSRLSGVMTTSFALKLSSKSDAGQIRYTTDGSIPTASSTLYNDVNGISINNSASRRIRARAFQSGLAPGPVRTEAYLAVSPALKAFDSNIPIVVIDTFGQAMPSTWWDGTTTVHADPIATYATFVDTNKVTGRAATVDQPDFAGRAGINIRGQSTALLDKKPYKLETWDENNRDKKVSLLGFPSDSDWVLSNPHTDRTFMRNVLAYQLSNDMGHYSSRTKFIEVFMNEGGGQIGGPGSSDYLGVYVLMEKIKRDKDRVDVEELRPTDSADPEITGGYIIKHDRLDEEYFSTWAGDFLYVEPSVTEITTPQKNYIKSYLEEFETVLQSGSFADPINGYAKYIDVESFIDHDFLSEISREVDTYRLSTYVTKDRGGKLVMSPEWDFNWSMGNNDYSVYGLITHHTTGWHMEAGISEYRWHARLRDDPEYLLKYADRWFHLRETVLSDATIAQTIDAHFALLNAEAAGRNFSRWDILNSFVGFGWTAPGPTFYYGGNPEIPCNTADHTYGMQVEWLKNWLTGTGTPSGSCAAEAYAPQYSDRLGWIDNNMEARTGASVPPTFFINGSPADTGGAVSVSDTLTMSGGQGTIYYTLDGTDPREAFTPATSTSTVILNAAAPCTARIPTSAGDAAGWKESEYNDAGWLTGTTGVGFEASPGTYDYTSLIGLDVSAMKDVNSTVYIRVPFTLADADSVTRLKLKMKCDDAFVAYINGTQVLSSFYTPTTPAAWDSSATSYNDDSNAVIFEEYDITASLSALQQGNNLLAIHGMNSSMGSSDLLFVPQLEATFSSSSTDDDSTAYSSEITLNKTVNVRARIKNDSNWSAMNQAVFADNGPLNNLRITEIMVHPETEGEEYIELKNIGASPIDLYLCEFTDGIQFTFPDLTLAAGQHVLVVENQTAFEARYGTGLTIAGEFDIGSALDNGGEEIVLRDAAGREIHDFDASDWYPVTDGRGASLCILDPAAADLTLWDQKEGWQASSANGGSPGTANPANAVTTGSIVINEALTHTDEAGGDWIELHNTTGLPIDIGGWFLSDSLDDLMKYQIAEGTSIAADGYTVFTQEGNFGLTSSDPGKITGFGLSELGDSIFLSSGSGGSLSGGFSISEDFGAATREVTFGRYTKSAASGSGVDFVAMARATRCTANSAPLIPAIAINQIMYNPSLQPDEVAEYIELFNRSRSTIHLYDPAHPSNTWKFTKGLDYTFPPGVSIPPGAHILVVRTDPDLFRYVYDIPLTRAIYGPYTDVLSNDGEKLELSMPGNPEPGFVPYIRTEKINFSDGSHPVGNDPWPSDADGTLGYSLQRKVAADYGNDVANWLAAAPTPMTPDLFWIELQRTESGLFLMWTADGVLQSTPQLTNTWINVPGATSPFEMVPDQPEQFFRVQQLP